MHFWIHAVLYCYNHSMKSQIYASLSLRKERKYKKGEALVTNRATYPVDDVVEPEDEDYIDATEGWWGVNISSVAYVDCVIFMLQMKSLVFLFFFVNQVLGFRVKALKSSLPLPPSPPPPLTTFISSAYYLTCAFQHYNCHSGLSMLPANIT